MKVFRVSRRGKICGEWVTWFIDDVFSTPEKANHYISEHPMDSWTFQEVVEQEVI